MNTQLHTVKINAVMVQADQMTDEYMDRMALELVAADKALVTLDHLNKILEEVDDMVIDEDSTLSKLESAILSARRWSAHIRKVSTQ